MTDSFQTETGRCSVSSRALTLHPRPEGVLPSHLVKTSANKRIFFYTGACVAAIAALAVSAIRGDYVVTLAAGMFAAWMLHGLVTSARHRRTIEIARAAIRDIVVEEPGAEQHGAFVVHYLDDELLRRVTLVPADTGEFHHGKRLMQESGILTPTVS